MVRTYLELLIIRPVNSSNIYLKYLKQLDLILQYRSIKIDILDNILGDESNKSILDIIISSFQHEEGQVKSLFEFIYSKHVLNSCIVS